MPVTSSRASTSWSPAGAVYMPIPDAPVKEIMKDMMEMSRAVQHLARGLFPRHYLSGQMRDNLPVATTKGTPVRNLQDSIAFELTNFIEMNKHWVPLRHQGHGTCRMEHRVSSSVSTSSDSARSAMSTSGCTSARPPLASSSKNTS
ncbi:hypothetical protein M0805_006622 [Coniferiporia weirii]|nr:hypothetical protein M0805_006622 [Coniferiporia weirii]